jgi:two-component sensor histidine kinase
VPIAVDAAPIPLDASTAQKLGVIANELITNAYQHGAPPLAVELTTGPRTRLRVEDGGNSLGGSSGFGLHLVRRIVEQGLRGQFELTRIPGGGTRAEVVFPARSS